MRLLPRPDNSELSKTEKFSNSFSEKRARGILKKMKGKFCGF
jgi:hypothetical protein